MFPKKFRLPLAKERGGWQKIFKSPYFLLKARDAGTGHNRFAAIIAASSVKKATNRNFWKRQFAARLQNWPNFKKDFLLIASPKIEAADKESIKNELNGILWQIIDGRQEHK